MQGGTTRNRVPSFWMLWLVALLVSGPGFSADPKAMARYAIGRVTFEDGKPITGDVQDYVIIKPTSKSIDGRELSPITVERAWRPKDSTPNDDLNDLPPATYELTGVARLPDGTTRPILLQGKGNYPKFVTNGIVTVDPDGIMTRMWKQPFGWVTD